MSKKKKLIIACSVVLVVILIGVIVGVVLLTMKRYDMTENDRFLYNDHTYVREINKDNYYSSREHSGNICSNGTIVVQNKAFKGVYSLIEDKLIIKAEYSGINTISLGKDGELGTLFDAKDSTGREIIFDEHGNNLGLLDFTASEGMNYTYIKERNTELYEKRSGIKVNAKNTFSLIRIPCNRLDYIESYYRLNDYNYELWKVTSTSNDRAESVYYNLYKVEGSSRTLVMTLNNVIGNSIELGSQPNDISIVFLKNGSPRLLVGRQNTSEESPNSITLSVYDTNLKEKGSATIPEENLNALCEYKFNDKLSSPYTNLYYGDYYDTTKFNYTFMVGNYMYFQYIIPSADSNYDFATNDGNITKYFKLKTYKLNLNSGKYSSVNFKYLVTGVNDKFNSETIILKTRKITKKSLESEVLSLVNDRLQLKDIDYNIDSITRITDDRLLVENEQGQYLIDNKYNKICFLGKYDNLFTTKDAVIVSSNTSGISLVCSLDGVVVATYRNDEIYNAHDDYNYIVKSTYGSGNDTVTGYYLERLGIRNNIPIYTESIENGNNYNYNGIEYYSVNLIEPLRLSANISLYLRIRRNEDSNFLYDLYTVDGKMLGTLPNTYTTINRMITCEYSDDNFVVLYISTNEGGVGSYLLVDR